MGWKKVYPPEFGLCQRMSSVYEYWTKRLKYPDPVGRHHERRICGRGHCTHRFQDIDNLPQSAMEDKTHTSAPGSGRGQAMKGTDSSRDFFLRPWRDEGCRKSGRIGSACTWCLVGFTQGSCSSALPAADPRVLASHRSRCGAGDNNVPFFLKGICSYRH